MRGMNPMMFVFITCLLGAMSFKSQAKDNLTMIEGWVVSAQAGTLVVQDERNRNRTVDVDSSAQVIIEGNLGALEDIRTGMKAHVTLDAGEVIVVSATKPTRGEAARELLE